MRDDEASLEFSGANSRRDAARRPQSSDPRLGLAQSWRSKAAEAHRLGTLAQLCAVLEECASQLEAVATREGEELLSLAEAALASGYSTDHLGRLIRRGEIPNSGRKGKPFVRTADLPRRPHVVRSSSAAYDVNADARLLQSRRTA